MKNLLDKVEALTPKQIVAELDKDIVGQQDAKKAVALAIRNRWRRQQIEGDLRDEIIPKNILMIGATGVGKTEIARRLAKLASSPFIKVEATKFTEIGYVGRDVESIIRDLIENALHLVQLEHQNVVNQQAKDKAREKIIKILAGENAREGTVEKISAALAKGEYDDTEINIEVEDKNPASSSPFFDIPGMPGAQMGMVNMGDMLSKALGSGKPKKKIRISVKDAYEPLVEDAASKLIDEDAIRLEAIQRVEQTGIVFIDEIDKVAIKENQRGNVSREGVQRDLLPLIEGTTVNTKHGNINTNHILFIASGAFHLSKPADLLPELQGRLPIRVEMEALQREDFERILREPQHNLISQYIALLKTEGLEVNFADCAITYLADKAFEMNINVENIGARRLHTIIEKVLEDISFNACESEEKQLTLDEAYVKEKLAVLDDKVNLDNCIL